jgi:hypothetical protein
MAVEISVLIWNEQKNNKRIAFHLIHIRLTAGVLVAGQFSNADHMPDN